MPLPPASVDLLCAFSVFTHMRSRDVAGYSAEMGRLLRPRGIAVLSAFVEFDVPPEVENPDGYLPELTWAGPLHCVRYECGYLTELIRDFGLEVVAFIHRDPGRAGQSLLFARPRAPSVVG